MICQPIFQNNPCHKNSIKHDRDKNIEIMSTVLTFCSLKARTMDRVQRMRDAKQLKMTNPSKTRIYWLFFWRTVKSQGKERVSLHISLSTYCYKMVRHIAFKLLSHEERRYETTHFWVCLKYNWPENYMGIKSPKHAWVFQN